MPLKSRDVAVPARLLPKLGIDHHVIHYPQTLDGEFKAVFLRNNASANTAYCRDIQALHTHYPSERVCVTGDAADEYRDIGTEAEAEGGQIVEVQPALPQMIEHQQSRGGIGTGSR